MKLLLGNEGFDFGTRKENSSSESKFTLFHFCFEKKSRVFWKSQLSQVGLFVVEQLLSEIIIIVVRPNMSKPDEMLQIFAQQDGGTSARKN